MVYDSYFLLKVLFNHKGVIVMDVLVTIIYTDFLFAYCIKRITQCRSKSTMCNIIFDGIY